MLAFYSVQRSQRICIKRQNSRIFPPAAVKDPLKELLYASFAECALCHLALTSSFSLLTSATANTLSSFLMSLLICNHRVVVDAVVEVSYFKGIAVTVRYQICSILYLH